MTRKGKTTSSLPRPRVRLVDVAAKAGVSATVVSAVLRGLQPTSSGESELQEGGKGATPLELAGRLGGGGGGGVRVGAETAKRIRRIADELNYRPNIAAQMLKGRRSDVIGVLIGAQSTPANFERLSAIEEAAHQRGLRLMIGQFRGGSDLTAMYMEDFLSRGIDQLICFHNPAPVFDGRVAELAKQMRRLVFQTQALLDNACCVDVDRAEGVRQAVAHLAERGCRRIGLLLNTSDDPLMQDRLRGYEAGLKELGRSVETDAIVSGDGQYPPPPDLIDRMVRKLVDRGQIDGVIASNDVWAINLIKGLRRRGLSVPKDVSVVGFDNLQAAELFDPPLTSIDQNHQAFAQAVIDRLLDSCQLPPGGGIVVTPQLVIRQST